MVDDDGRRTDDGRTPDHGHPINSPCEPNGSGELKTWYHLKGLDLNNNAIISLKKIK